MRRHMWLHAQEDDDVDDPEGTLEPVLGEKEVRVCLLFY